MLTDESVLTRVNRGYLWLATAGPALGLHLYRVNPDTIHVGSSTRCPLAQASGIGMYSIGLHMAGRRGDAKWAIDHGFVVRLGHDEPGAHNQAWRDLLLGVPAPLGVVQ